MLFWYEDYYLEECWCFLCIYVKLVYVCGDVDILIFWKFLELFEFVIFKLEVLKIWERYYCEDSVIGCFY